MYSLVSLLIFVVCVFSFSLSFFYHFKSCMCYQYCFFLNSQHLHMLTSLYSVFNFIMYILIYLCIHIFLLSNPQGEDCSEILPLIQYKNKSQHGLFRLTIYIFLLLESRCYLEFIQWFSGSVFILSNYHYSTTEPFIH